MVSVVLRGTDHAAAVLAGRRGGGTAIRANHPPACSAAVPHAPHPGCGCRAILPVSPGEGMEPACSHSAAQSARRLHPEGAGAVRTRTRTLDAAGIIRAGQSGTVCLISQTCRASSVTSGSSGGDSQYPPASCPAWPWASAMPVMPSTWPQSGSGRCLCGYGRRSLCGQSLHQRGGRTHRGCGPARDHDHV